MEKLFLPTTSLNFNNIFSCETISPQIFYSKRKFGYKRFDTIGPNPFSNSLLLYNKYPQFEIIDSEKDNYPIVFEFERNDVSENIYQTYKKDDLEIFQIANSVYINPFNVKIYFASQKNLQTTLIKSELSLETKLVPLYRPCFEVDEKIDNCFLWSDKLLDSVVDIEESLTLNPIINDQKINRIKGFSYCYIMGANKSLPLELIELKRLLIEIKNNLSVLINILLNRPKPSNKSFHKREDEVIDLQTEIKRRLDELNNKINRYINLSESIDPFKQENLKIELKTIQSFDLSESEAEKIIMFLKTLKSGRYSLYEHFQNALISNNYYKKVNKSSSILEQILLFINSQYRSDIKSDSSFKINHIDLAIQQVEESLNNFETHYIDLNQKLTIENAFSISNLRLTSLFDNFIVDSTLIYQVLINTIIDLPIESAEHFRNSKIDIVLTCGKALKEYFENWESSREREYINSLLDNIESYQPFDLRSHNDPILQSFAAFIIKGDDPDRLIDFLISNKINDFRLSLGLWGASFGFAAIPKTLTEKFFTSNPDYIETFIKSLYKQILPYIINENLHLKNKIFDMQNLHTRNNGDIKTKEDIKKVEPLIDEKKKKFDQDLWKTIESNIRNLSKKQREIIKKSFDWVLDYNTDDQFTTKHEYFINKLKYETKKSTAKKPDSKLNDEIIIRLKNLIS